MWRNGSLHAVGKNEMEELLCKKGGWRDGGRCGQMHLLLLQRAQAPFQHPHLTAVHDFSSRGSILFRPLQSPCTHTYPQTHTHKKNLFLEIKNNCGQGDGSVVTAFVQAEGPEFM